MKKMKKLSVMLVCIMLVGLLSGCGNSFDAAGYISAILDNSYKNDSSKFVSMKIGTAEEASETYETSLKGEVDTLVYLSSAGEASDEQYEKLKGIMTDIYGQTKYNVDGAEKQDDGSYVVTITYEQINVFGPAMESYITELDSLNNEYMSTGEYPSDEELTTILFDTYIGCFENAVANVTFDEPATATIRVELKDKLWQPNEDDVLAFETSLFDIDALQKALQ